MLIGNEKEKGFYDVCNKKRKPTKCKSFLHFFFFFFFAFFIFDEQKKRKLKMENVIWHTIIQILIITTTRKQLRNKLQNIKILTHAFFFFFAKQRTWVRVIFVNNASIIFSAFVGYGFFLCSLSHDFSGAVVSRVAFLRRAPSYGWYANDGSINIISGFTSWKPANHLIAHCCLTAMELSTLNKTTKNAKIFETKKKKT